MVDTLTNYFWQHPVAVVAAIITVIIILIWMAGSGSRQRFVTFKRTKETDQLARDLSRIAAALERIAKNQETPTDYVGRPILPNWESTMSSGEPVEESAELEPLAEHESPVPVGTGAAPGHAEPASPKPPASSAAPTAASENTSASFGNLLKT